MTDDAIIRDLFSRWEDVWNDGRHELAVGCVAPVYTRHEPAGLRTVTPSQYAAEIVEMHRQRPNTRISVYDHAISPDRAWLRWTWAWTDPATGAAQALSGVQVYRVEGGKLAETWVTPLPVGVTWPDTVAQERWVPSAPGPTREPSPQPSPGGIGS
jgi:hypothetical protein